MIAPAPSEAKAAQKPTRAEALRMNDMDYHHVTIQAEPWNRWLLSDGSILKIRSVLLKMVRSPDLGPDGPHQARVSSLLLVVVETLERHRGQPGPPVLIGDAAKRVEEELTWEVLEAAPSVYGFEDGRSLIVNVTPRRVARTSVTGPDGDRVYVVETATESTTMGGPGVGQEAPANSVPTAQKASQ